MVGLELSLVSCYCTDVHVTEEKGFESDSVEYGEIPLVLNRWGNALLQVKDQKAGNARITRKRRVAPVTSETRAPSVSTVDKEVEDLNTQHVLYPRTLLDDGEEPVTRSSLMPMQKARTFETIQYPRFVAAPQLSTPPRIVNNPPSGIAPNHDTAVGKGVRFALQPPAEISSSRATKIERLQAQLAALQANPGRNLSSDNFHHTNVLMLTWITVMHVTRMLCPKLLFAIRRMLYTNSGTSGCGRLLVMKDSKMSRGRYLLL
jgi:hypothetical protein